VKLLVDVGNARIKWAGLVAGELTSPGNFAHHGDPAAAATALLDHVGAAIDEVLVSNVAGTPFADAISAVAENRWHKQVRFATSQARAGRVRNAYRDHTKLGVDRWLAILAAAHRYGRAACIVDAGTAVTIDIVLADGAHVGGFIVPGVTLMRRSLTRDTGDLGRFMAGDDPEIPASLAFGRDTGEAIGHGSLAAICALIERCAARLAEDNRDLVVVVTGGDAGRIAPHLTVDFDHRPQLVLEGLMLWEPG